MTRGGILGTRARPTNRPAEIAPQPIDIAGRTPYTYLIMLSFMESSMVAFLLASTAAMRKLRAVNWPIAVSGPLVLAA